MENALLMKSAFWGAIADAAVSSDGKMMAVATGSLLHMFYLPVSEKLGSLSVSVDGGRLHGVRWITAELLLSWGGNQVAVCAADDRGRLRLLARTTLRDW